MDESSIRNHFLSILQLSPGASPEEIKAAYKREALKWHTDKVEHNEELKEIANERLIAINAAYECLTDPTKLRKFMAKAARTGWKPGQKAGSTSGTKETNDASSSTSGAGESHGQQTNHEQSAQGNPEPEQNPYEAFIAAQVKVERVAAAAAMHAASALRAESPDLRPGEFYRVLYAEVMTAAKIEAETQVNRLQLSQDQTRAIYDHARQSAQRVAQVALNSYKRDNGNMPGAGYAFLKDSKPIKIAAILLGLFIVGTNADSIEKMWQEIKSPPAQHKPAIQPPTAMPAPSLLPKDRLLPGLAPRFAPPAEPPDFDLTPIPVSTGTDNASPFDTINELTAPLVAAPTASPYDSVAPATPTPIRGAASASQAALRRLLQTPEYRL